MNVYWVRPEDDDVFHVLEAVRRQLDEHDHGDPRLAESLRTVRFLTLDHEAVLASKRRVLGPVLTRIRRLLTKALWWYGLPQWGQVAEFQKAASDVVDVLLAEQGNLRRRIAALEEKVRGPRPPGPDAKDA